jgi:hypothetical protein
MYVYLSALSSQSSSDFFDLPGCGKNDLADTEFIVGPNTDRGNTKTC